MSSTEMATPDYSGARHDEIRQQPGRRAKVPARGVDVYAYYGIGDQIVVVTMQYGAMFIHGRTGTLNFYHEDIGGFVKACVNKT